MNTQKRYIQLIRDATKLALLLPFFLVSHAEEPAKPLSTYDTNNDGISVQEFSDFLYDQYTLAEKGSRSPEELRNKADFDAGNAFGRLGLEGSENDRLSVEALMALPPLAEEEPIAKRGALAGFFGESRTTKGGSKVGPFRLRNSVDDWNPSADPRSGTGVGDAIGASFNYINSRRDRETTFEGKGALLYPIVGETIRALPSASWEVRNIDKTSTSDVEEFRFELPISYYAIRNRGLNALRANEIIFRPLLQTDFSFRGLISGARLEWKPIIQTANSRLAVNTGFRRIGGGETRRSPLKYRLEFKPHLDFSRLHSSSRFISRETENFANAGFSAGLFLKTPPIYRDFGFQAGVQYRGMFGLGYGPDYFDKLSVSIDSWLNLHFGFSIGYDQGRTEWAQKRLDVFTLGVKARF